MYTFGQPPTPPPRITPSYTFEQPPSPLGAYVLFGWPPGIMIKLQCAIVLTSLCERLLFLYPVEKLSTHHPGRENIHKKKFEKLP